METEIHTIPQSGAMSQVFTFLLDKVKRAGKDSVKSTIKLEEKIVREYSSNPIALSCLMDF